VFISIVYCVAASLHCCVVFISIVRSRPPFPNDSAPQVWIVRWFYLTTLIVTWDCSYSLLHPWSRDANDPISSRLYAPYQQTYSKIDLFYGPDAAFAAAGLGPNVFGPVQSQMNAVEIALNILFLYFEAVRDARALAVGIIVATMTAAKTITYFLMCNMYGWTLVVPTSAMRNASEIDQFVRLFLIPNGVWIVVPTLVALSLARIISSLVPNLKIKAK
jgi:hypothetical protein